MAARLRDLQAQFSRYLLGADNRMVDHVVDDAGLDAQQRLDIYATAYRLRLREAIATDHDVLGRYLGDTLFERMAAEYIAAHPSRYSSLRRFGDALPAFLRETDPYREHPVLGELAAFERSLLDVFDAGDGQLADAGNLSLHEPAAWPELGLRFHPSVRLFEAKLNSVEIWKALRAGHEPPPAIPRPGRWLLWRGRERLSEFRPLDDVESALLASALRGGSFAALCECLTGFLPDDAAPAAFIDYLSRWLTEGLVTAIGSAGI